jgi:predicted amidohydrolase YtcJ
MCLRCDTLPKLALTAPGLKRRQFLAQAVQTAGLYAAAKITGTTEVLAQSRDADMIIEHAKVITLDSGRPSAEAIAIRADRIVGIGSRSDMKRFKGRKTILLDAGGRTIIPGLNDSHTHLIRGGLTFTQELRWDGVPSLMMALRMLRAQAQRTPAPHWVQVVGGWSPYQFSERRQSRHR